MNKDCLFCKIGTGAIPSEKIYESDTLFAISDINPQAPTHILIIPRAHHSSLLDIEEADHEIMGSVISVANNLAKERGLDKSGYRLVVNCGESAGQTVDYPHVHLIPRRKGDMDDPRGGVRHVIPEKGNYKCHVLAEDRQPENA